MIGYEPTEEDAVAVGEKLGAPVTTADVSPFTYPEMVAVNVGKGAPTTLLASLAVTVSMALFTTSVRDTAVATL